MTEVQSLSICVNASEHVSALLMVPRDARACYVLAHGAGAGMDQPFMAAVASGLADRGVATLRYQFPYMQRGSKRPDLPPLAHATVRAAVGEAVRQLPNLALIAGGKSFGGRMTSQTQASAALPNVRGLAFLGFPLHPPKRPSIERAAHLSKIEVPMLFLQGTRDELADLSLLGPVIDQLGARAKLHTFDGADHAFHVLARSGRTDADVLTQILDALAAWIQGVVAAG